MQKDLIQPQPGETGLKKKRTIQDYEFVTDSKSKTPDLGKGSYGSVKLALDKTDNKHYAIKIVMIFIASASVNSIV